MFLSVHFCNTCLGIPLVTIEEKYIVTHEMILKVFKYMK